MGRASQFDKLKGFITYEDEQRYKDVAEQLKTSADQLKTEVCRLRDRHRELIRREIASTVDRPEDIETELYDLLKALTVKPEHPLVERANYVLRQPS